MNKKTTKTSRFLSLILRHKPETIGITLDDQGWTRIDTLIRQTTEHHHPLTHTLLLAVVKDNEKQRFSISDDGLYIRANQGHSVKVDLGLTPLTPPETLYHGTPERNLDSILQAGLDKRQRHHVHLSPDQPTAIKVGKRRGKPVVLHIQAQTMFAQGHLFYRSENGVWLVDHVPASFISTGI